MNFAREMNFAPGALPIGSSPSPLRGRDREGGKPLAPNSIGTPLPNPPPQGGREQSGVRAKWCIQ